MSTLLITCTSGRPKAFELLQKVIAKQNTQDFDWLVVCDDPTGYKFTNKKIILLKRDPSPDTVPSFNGNLLAAMEWVEGNEDYDKLLIIEDDDYYARSYVLETTQHLEQSDLFGWNHDAYYYVLSRKARRTHNIDFAALASTAFNRSVIPYLKKCVSLGVSHVDMLLWRGIWEETTMQQPPLIRGNMSVVPDPARYTKLSDSFKGKKRLANNFTGQLEGVPPELKWNDQGKLELHTHQPLQDEHGDILDEHPRHVGMKEPWHAGKAGTTSHDPRWAGGPDSKGAALRKWIGEDAKLYLQFTKEIDMDHPPAFVLIPFGAEK